MNVFTHPKDKSEVKKALFLLLHGLTRSRELVNIASDLGIGILLIYYICMYVGHWMSLKGSWCAQQK